MNKLKERLIEWFKIIREFIKYFFKIPSVPEIKKKPSIHKQKEKPKRQK